MWTRPPVVFCVTCLLSCAAAAWGQSATTQPKLDPAVDKILTRLEQRTVEDLRARVAWRQRYLIDEEEDALTKMGEIWYQDQEPVARFIIHFDERIASGRKDKLDERHLFDGCWYVELQSRTKTLTRREVRRPTDRGDPYKVGEGVFPLPFGQKKEDIVREFKVDLVERHKDDPEGTDHIRLTPRDDTRTGKMYKRLDFWIQRAGPLAGLPLAVRVAKKDGTGRVNSYITISFADARLNTGISDSVFELKCPPGYEEIVERLEPIPPPRNRQDEGN